MKFRDPKTGEVFEDIEEAMNAFCYDSHRECDKCVFCNKNCRQTWVHDHPAEAARLMGYEVIDDSSSDSSTEIDDTPTASGDTPTDKDTTVPDKPRLAEVLGVEVGEKIRILGGCYHTVEFCIEKNGFPSTDVYPALTYAINHPESIIRLPRLTEPEIAIMRAVGAKWVSRNQIGTNSLHLWDKKPDGNKNFWNGGATSLATVAECLFPSVHPGDCIAVENI